MIYTDHLLTLFAIIVTSFYGFQFFVDWQESYRQKIIYLNNREHRHILEDTFDAVEDRYEYWHSKSRSCSKDEELDL